MRRVRRLPAVPTESVASGKTSSVSGSVIKLGMISDVGTADVNFTDAVAAGNGAVRPVNTRGVLDGVDLGLSS